MQGSNDRAGGRGSGRCGWRVGAGWKESCGEYRDVGVRRAIGRNRVGGEERPRELGRGGAEGVRGLSMGEGARGES